MAVRNMILTYLTEKKPPGWFKYKKKYLVEDGALLNEFNSEKLKELNVLMKFINYQGDIILKPVLNEFISKALQDKSSKKIYIFMKLLKQAMPGSGVKSYTLKKVLDELQEEDKLFSSCFYQGVRAVLEHKDVKGKFGKSGQSWSGNNASVDMTDFPHMATMPQNPSLHLITNQMEMLHAICEKKSCSKEELKLFEDESILFREWTKGRKCFVHRIAVSGNEGLLQQLLLVMERYCNTAEV